MCFKEYIKKFKVKYLEEKIKSLDEKLPSFKEGEDCCRKKFRFIGMVQGVGFRIETKLVADKLGLTGKAMNLYDGSVEVEVQGEREKIDYLVEYLHRVKRFQIESYEEQEVAYENEEKEFVIGIK